MVQPPHEEGKDPTHLRFLSRRLGPPGTFSKLKLTSVPSFCSCVLLCFCLFVFKEGNLKKKSTPHGGSAGL